MNERFRNNGRNDAQSVVEHLRHRALRSPQAEHLAAYVAERFKTTGCHKVAISWQKYFSNVTKSDWEDLGIESNYTYLHYKRENGRYYVLGGPIKEWTDVTDTNFPCKHATDPLDLMEKYFILSNLGYIVKKCELSIDVFLPQVDYHSYI